MTDNRLKMVKVKICGITNLKDALFAVKAGCDGLGFVFYRKSPRYIEPDEARKIIKKLPEGIVKIGVFAGEKQAIVKKIAAFCGLDILQFSGDETPAYCSRFKTFRVIKAFRVSKKIQLKDIARYKTFACLFDKFEKSKFGGTGKTFDWSLLMGRLKGIRKTVFLSGGLNEKNVSKAIRSLRPDWVDSSSCLESSPGRKDKDKMKRFISKAKSVK